MLIGILSDIHEDSVRLGEALRKLEKLGCTQLACLGDITGFDAPYYRYLSTRDASACIMMVKENCRWVVAGNHDLFAVRKLPLHSVGFSFPDNWYDLDFSDRKAAGYGRVWLYEHMELPTLIGSNEKEYLASLPEYIVADFDGHQVFLSHSLAGDLSGSTMQVHANAWEFAPHHSLMQRHGCKTGISGHLHPGGMIVSEKEQLFTKAFGKTHFQGEYATQFVAPCIAHSSSPNGFLIFDTRTLAMKAVPIQSKPYQIKHYQ